MKSKLIKHLLVAFLLILLAAPQVFAMEIVVDQQGEVHFYESKVLGDEDSEEKESEQEQRQERQERREAKKTEVKTEIRTIAPYQRKQFEFKQEDDGRYKVEIQDGKEKMKLRGNATTNQPESLETDSVDLSIPINADEKKRKEKQLEQIKARIEKIQTNENLTEEEKTERLQQQEEKLAKYQEKLSEERQKKLVKEIKLKSADNNENGFEIETNEVKAKLRGADFNYDQESGLVSIVTPSGQEHTLTHLPDEAIARMTAQGFFVDSNQEVEIEASEGDQVQYTVPAKKTKKLFGVFNRQIDSKVVLDDLTGEVTEKEVPANNFWSNFLNRFSY